MIGRFPTYSKNYKSGAQLAGAKGVLPKSTIFRDRFSNPSIFGHIELKSDGLVLYVPQHR